MFFTIKGSMCRKNGAILDNLLRIKAFVYTNAYLLKIFMFPENFGYRDSPSAVICCETHYCVRLL